MAFIVASYIWTMCPDNADKLETMSIAEAVKESYKLYDKLDCPSNRFLEDITRVFSTNEDAVVELIKKAGWYETLFNI